VAALWQHDPWTVGDIPLLNEAAELLGEDDTEARAMEMQGEMQGAAGDPGEPGRP
jgi:hypothetical protein